MVEIIMILNIFLFQQYGKNMHNHILKNQTDA